MSSTDPVHQLSLAAEVQTEGSASAVTVTIAAVTHRGAMRPDNQDAAGAAGWLVADDNGVVTMGPIAVPTKVAVADGAGGHPAGDVASRLATTHVLASIRPAETAEQLDALIRSAHFALHDRMRLDRSTRGMTTTIAVLSLTEKSVLIGHVGDTRVFELGPEGLTPLTENDRSAAGGTALTQALGGSAAEPHPSPHLARLAREPGLRFLLCTDGFEACLDEATLQKLVLSYLDDTALVAALLSAALQAGAPDNVTAVVVRLGEANEIVGSDDRAPAPRDGSGLPALEDES